MIFSSDLIVSLTPSNSFINTGPRKIVDVSDVRYQLAMDTFSAYIVLNPGESLWSLLSQNIVKNNPVQTDSQMFLTEYKPLLNTSAIHNQKLFEQFH